MRKAEHELAYHNNAPIEDLVVPVRLGPLSKLRLTRLGTLLDEHQRYKQRWLETVGQYIAAFKKLKSSDMSTFDRMSTLYTLASAHHGLSQMKSLASEPFYQSEEMLMSQLADLSSELLERAEEGSKDDFFLLQRFLVEVAKGRWEDGDYYPSNYPELVDLHIEDPSYEDYLVRAVSPMSQARYSNSLRFLRLFIEKNGGSAEKLSSPPMQTHAGQYFDELDLYTLYDIEKRIQELSIEESKNN